MLFPRANFYNKGMTNGKGVRNVAVQKKESIVTHLKKNKAIYLMALPAPLWYVVFKYIPLLGSVIAFQDYSIFRGISGSRFVGLANFKKLFAYPDFYNILQNTILIGVYDIVLSFPMPIILALALNEVRSKKYKKCI